MDNPDKEKRQPFTHQNAQNFISSVSSYILHVHSNIINRYFKFKVRSVNLGGIISTNYFPNRKQSNHIVTYFNSIYSFFFQICFYLKHEKHTGKNATNFQKCEIFFKDQMKIRRVLLYNHHVKRKLYCILLKVREIVKKCCLMYIEGI